MNKIRLNEEQKGRTDQSSEGNQSHGFVDKTPFLTAKVVQILTEQNEETIEEVVNEYKKYFSCYETQIGICFEF